MRPSVIFAALWLLALVVIVMLVRGDAGYDLPHAYLSAWLVLVSMPLGSLVALMALEVMDRAEAAIAVPLRLLLATLPIMALLFVPILFDLDNIYQWPVFHEGLAAHWFTPFWFATRAIIAFIVWIGLSLYFLRPARPSASRRMLAAFGLLAHLVLGTITAYDWYMSLDAGFVSSVYGLVVISSQVVFALSVALGLNQLGDGGLKPHRAVGLAVVVALFAAIYVQFSQYLVIWSANLPKEIVWYQTRWHDVTGPALVYGGPILIILACAILLLPAFASRRALVLAALGVLVLVEVLDLIALVSPRETFTVSAIAIDGLFLVVIAGLAAASARLFGHRETRQMRHG